MTIGEHTDGQLVRLAAEGDRRTFDVLAGRHLAALGAYILSRAPTREDAEDIIQETLLSAWRGIASFCGTSAVRTWLFAIARRKLADLYRARYGNQEHDGLCVKGLADAELDGDISDSDGGLQTASTGVDLSNAIGRLCNAERELVFLVYRAGFTCDEAAELTGVPVGTVKSRLSAARTKLKKYLGDGYDE